MEKRHLEPLVSAGDSEALHLLKESRRVRPDFATRVNCPASRKSKAQTSFPEERGRFAFLFGGQRSRQNDSLAPECPRGALGAVAPGSEIHPDGSKDHCGIRPVLPSPSDCDLLLRRAERPLDESYCCPGARTLVPEVRAKASAAAPVEYRLPRPEKVCLCR